MRLSWRVGTDNFESLIRTNPAVTDTGRKHHQVAGFQPEETAVFTTQLHSDSTLCDTQNLVSIG
jgi:hypothetical protein